MPVIHIFAQVASQSSLGRQADFAAKAMGLRAVACDHTQALRSLLALFVGRVDAIRSSRFPSRSHGRKATGLARVSRPLLTFPLSNGDVKREFSLLYSNTLLDNSLLSWKLEAVVVMERFCGPLQIERILLRVYPT